MDMALPAGVHKACSKGIQLGLKGIQDNKTARDKEGPACKDPEDGHVQLKAQDAMEQWSKMNQEIQVAWNSRTRVMNQEIQSDEKSSRSNFELYNLFADNWSTLTRSV